MTSRVKRHQQEWAEEGKRLERIVRSILRGECSQTESEIKAALLKDKSHTSIARVDVFRRDLQALFKRTASAELFPGDRNQPSMTSILSDTIRAAVELLADKVGYDQALKKAKTSIEYGLMVAHYHKYESD